MAAWVLGQMSGTSADGVDVALLQTDGGAMIRPGPGSVLAYKAGEREAILAGVLCARESETRVLRDLERWPEPIRTAHRSVTDAHLRALSSFLRSADQNPALLGYHGQTLLHRPAEGLTLQVGCAKRISSELGLTVAFQLRQADLEAGGEGAPLAPFFHHAVARASGLSTPTAFLNLGGIGNVTLVDPRVPEPDTPGAVSAFDTGPGCGLIDEWAEFQGAGKFDRDGMLARQGTPSSKALSSLLQHPYFSAPPPKSLDRGAFSLDPVRGLPAGDGAATLVEFTAEAAAMALNWMEPEPASWLVCGGGRRNPALMDALRRAVVAPVEPIESIGWSGDLLEAYAFAYLGMRALLGRTISAPATTGCVKPAAGGRIEWSGDSCHEGADRD